MSDVRRSSPGICVSCRPKDKKINELSQKLKLLQQSLHASVTECKSLKPKCERLEAECKQKDDLISNMLSDGSTISGSLTEKSNRISELEENITELTVICGEYKSQRQRDRQLIDQLTAKLKSFETESSDVSSASQDDVPEVKLFRSRLCQTDVINEKETREAGTQTQEMAVSIKKPELAIVIPNLHEIQLPDVKEDTDSGIMPPDDVSPVIPDADVKSDEDNHPIRRSSSTRRSGRASVSSVDNTSSLVYANELARKEMEIAELRLKTREAECALRELQWTSAVEKFRLKAKVSEYEKLLNQKAKDKQVPDVSSDQAKMVYVRNVLLQYTKSRDEKQRKIMLKALFTALDLQQ